MSVWPTDVDGDVLREIEAGGFDFSKPTLIDFNVDFETWPPPKNAVDVLAQDFPGLKIQGKRTASAIAAYVARKG
jgi:hypothetical protein